MKKLINVTADGHMTIVNTLDPTQKDLEFSEVPAEVHGQLWKLKDYEETGLSPDQIKNKLFIEEEKHSEATRKFYDKLAEFDRLNAEFTKLLHELTEKEPWKE